MGVFQEHSGVQNTLILPMHLEFQADLPAFAEIILRLWRKRSFDDLGGAGRPGPNLTEQLTQSPPPTGDRFFVPTG